MPLTSLDAPSSKPSRNSSASCSRTFQDYYDSYLSSGPSRAARARRKLSVLDPAVYLKLNQDRIARKENQRRQEELDRARAAGGSQPPALLERTLRLQTQNGKWPADKSLAAALVYGSPFGEEIAMRPPDGIAEWKWFTALSVAYLRQYPEYFDKTSKACELGARWLGSGTVMQRAMQVMPSHAVLAKSKPVLSLHELESQTPRQHSTIQPDSGRSNATTMSKTLMEESLICEGLLGTSSIVSDKGGCHGSTEDVSHQSSYHTKESVSEQLSHLNTLSTVSEKPSDFTVPSGVLTTVPSHLTGDTEVTFTSILERQKARKEKEENSSVERLLFQASTLTDIADSRTKLACNPKFRNARDRILMGTTDPLCGSLPLWRQAANILESQNAQAMNDIRESGGIAPLIAPEDSVYSTDSMTSVAKHSKVSSSSTEEQHSVGDLKRIKHQVECSMKSLIQNRQSPLIPKTKAEIQRDNYQTMEQIMKQRLLLGKQWKRKTEPVALNWKPKAGDSVESKWYQSSRLENPRESTKWHKATVLRVRPTGRLDIVVHGEDGEQMKLRGVQTQYIRKGKNDRAALDAAKGLAKKWLARDDTNLEESQVCDIPRVEDEIKELEVALEIPIVKPEWHKWQHEYNINIPEVKQDETIGKDIQLHTVLSSDNNTDDPTSNDQGTRPSSRTHSKSISHNAVQNIAYENKITRLELQLNQSKDNSIKSIMIHEDLLQRIRVLLKQCSLGYKRSVTHEELNHAFDELTETLIQFRVRTCATIESILAWRKILREIAVAKDEHAGRTVTSTLDPVQKTFEDVDPDFILMNPKHNQPGPRPFIWNGLNYMLTISKSLDFLSKSAQLKQWYGSDFPMKRNPFSVAISLDNRPPTPVKATRTVILDGKEVQQFSRPLAEQRIKEQAVFECAKDTVITSPKWWPSCEEMMWLRVRRCERVLLQEEQWAACKFETLQADHGAKDLNLGKLQS